MPHAPLSRDHRIPEIINRLAKRYEHRGMSAQEARQRATAEIEDRAFGSMGAASGTLPAGFGKGTGPKGSSARNMGQSRTMEVKSRSDAEKKQSAMRKSSHQKSPGQKRIRGHESKTQS